MKKYLSSLISHLSFRKGFTLIELLVVIAIIGVLSAGLIVALNPLAQIQKANDAKRKSDLKQIQNALETYYNDSGRYPAASSDYKMNPPTGKVEWGATNWPYMGSVPKDPSTSQNYAYCSPAASSGQSYYLYAGLQRGGTQSLPADCSGANCGSGVTCNYGVASSNVSP